MRALEPDAELTFAQVEREVLARDREMDNKYSKDLQVVAMRGARKYLPTESRALRRRTACLTPRPVR